VYAFSVLVPLGFLRFLSPYNKPVLSPNIHLLNSHVIYCSFKQRYYSKDVATYLNDDIFLVFVCWTRGASQGVQGVTIVYIS
jgi:hypothetical protein